MSRPKRIFVKGLAVWLLLSTGAVTVFTWPDRRTRAVIGMGWGLILLWIGLGGAIMYRFRGQIRDWVLRIGMRWQIKFILFATLLALVEEAITTTMTNLAPLFGVKVGEAYITASTNYLDVVALHSVIVFVPMFAGWAWILSRWNFSPFAVFLLFGLTGTVAETSFGPQHLLEFGMWIFVYGLMIYLPSYCVPAERRAAVPGWWEYPLAIFVPFLFIPLMLPVVLVLHRFFPNHPNIHFPPIGH
ncbi:MAG: hypothetical protein ACYDH9_13355 [Limisphaerales bacterium]